MDVRAKLIPTRVPRDPHAAVLVLHGGASRREGMQVSPTQLSVVRMIPIASRIARAGRGRLAVYRLLNSVRGWDSEHTPVQDVQWALEQVRGQLTPDIAVGLVGHSLGGRAAVLSAGASEVRSVVALAPWVYPQDGDVRAPGRRVLMVHGTEDRIADPGRSAEAARRLGRTATVSYVRVLGGKHAMLRRHQVFENLATDFTVATLLGAASDRDERMTQLLAGTTLEV